MTLVVHCVNDPCIYIYIYIYIYNEIKTGSDVAVIRL